MDRKATPIYHYSKPGGEALRGWAPVDGRCLTLGTVELSKRQGAQLLQSSGSFSLVSRLTTGSAHDDDPLTELSAKCITCRSRCPFASSADSFCPTDPFADPGSLAQQ
ncbi:hypothetical protein D917_04388 [Trichinella nativa]|uniref:Uncharacterized protein n=1 Tax=Trichinella nativa TaxID=6335 RepID=A0A1Y3E877_9BILA|nr:hypothetical protein D917_04388 [Trichinella nativa]